MKKSKKNRTPFYKKWWFWAIIVFLLIGVFSGGNETGENDSTLSSGASTDVHSATNPTTDNTAESGTYPSTESSTEPIATEPAETTLPETDPPETNPPKTEPVAEPTETFILNTNTEKFHEPSCRSVKDMNEENKKEYTGTREEVIVMGYEPCGICHP